ncbi:TonB-dependent siderophore receptor [Pseudomonas aegrilactucae]|uniref:TonB-dependent receptor n=1 Tax=Pseudomonas aegrilactucae TaxID=2854028 RepID=A0A9Q2XJP3_9PSED|nr:TonB-dependent receptor [Pseudomonas aegrilactucae]MBV6287442.1 TonB-dependent receptor [Pseudomonas aegrilactucae]
MTYHLLPRPSPLCAMLGRTLLCSALILPALLPASVNAEPAVTQRFDLAPDDLGRALTRFAAEAGVVLSFDASLTRGRQSAGLHGHYAVAAGLSQLLQGSGLHAVRDGSGRYQLVPVSAAAGAVALGATTVNAEHLGASTEDTGSYTTGTMPSATKLALTARQTPQSVSVITRQRMDDRGMQTLHDVVKDTPGLTLANDGPERPTYYARGFTVDNILYDGLPTTVSSYTARDTIAAADTAMLDHVEVVRGATGLMTGSGSPSAAINLVRKRPTRDPQASISLGAGSWNNYRGELDASSALNDSGSVRGRVVSSYQVKDSFQDVVNKEHSLFYAITEADLSDSTTLTLGASNQNLNNNTAWGGVPTGADGRDLKLSRSTYLGNDWGRWDQDNNTLFTELEQRFDNDWKLRLAATKRWSKLDLFASYASAGMGDTFNQMTGKFRYENDQTSYDLYASGPFQLLEREHELVVGASNRRETFEGYGTTVLTASAIDIHNWNPHITPKPAVDMGAWQQQSETEQTGAYLTGRFSLADPLHLILGGRLDWYDYQIESKGSPRQTDKVTRNVTRYAGLVYDLNDTYSVYVSYTDIFSPQGVVDTRNAPIKPITGKNYEAGIKGEFFDGALNASAAVYRIDQQNRASITTVGCQAPAGVSCYVASGEVRSEGLELEVNGALTPNWQLAAGYTYNAAKYRKDAIASNEGRLFNSDLPRHLFKLNTTYTLPGALQRWRVGGGLTSQNTTFNQGEGYRIEQEGYTLVDLMVGHRLTENIDLRLNVNNVFDKKYYQTINSNTWNAFNVYGEPRNFMLSAKYTF